MNIRPARDKDSMKIKSLVSEVLREYNLKFDLANTDKDLDSIEESYFLNDGFFGVIEERSEIVATVGLYKVNSTTCELRKMYSLSSQRGNGLGKVMMELIFKKAKELNYHHIILETASSLKEAISLYEKYGFKKYASKHLSSRCDQAFELYLE